MSIETKAIEIIKTLAPNNKITKGNITKIRRYYLDNNLFSSNHDLWVALTDTVSMADRHLDRRASNRPTLTAECSRMINFDFNNIPGCIGFTREFVS